MSVAIRAPQALLLAVFSFWLGGCASSPPVAVDYDPQADFSRMESYYLLDPLASGPVAPLELKRAGQALDGLLRMRFRPASDPAEADFLVRVQLQGSERVAVYEDRLGLYGGGGYWGFGWQVPLNVREYRQTILVVDMLSPTKEPLWRGSLLSRAQGAGSPEQQQQRLREEAALILNRFPPPVPELGQ